MQSTTIDDANDLSRQISHQSFLSDDTAALTFFGDPISKRRSKDSESTNHALYGLLEDHGPSMFDENNTIDVSNPQSLSAAPLPVLQNVIDHHGAVELVRRLTTALAERDAHITALTRLAEEYNVPRERIVDTASRVKRAEIMRLSLANASEDLISPSAIGSDSGVRPPSLLHFELHILISYSCSRSLIR